MTKHRDTTEPKLPLHDEAVARSKWRGETLLSDNEDDPGLPASEMAPAGEDIAGQGNDGSKPGGGRSGAFPPPD